jgi:hypothetical protein
MKLNTKEATVESNMTFGKSVDMGISANGVAHLMSLLTNLYNDPETAVIREYYTNALDAHVRVGQTKPVEIYLPTRDNPLYVVKDFGVGMSASDIEFIYSQYGESTKQDTDDEIGAYGLGCKSALAIATQFTLTAIQDGIKTTALISKTESGINSVDILPSKPTEEGNGVTVTIPVPDVAMFNNKVSKFFTYSDSTKVKINGRHPESVFAGAEVLDLKIPGVVAYTKEMRYSYGSPEIKIIMGNVPYDFSMENVEDALRRQGITFDMNYAKRNVYFVVPIGAVDLTPPREGLRYSDKTKNKVDEIMKAYVERLRETAQAEIDAVEKRHEVFAVVKKWERILNKDTVKWRGEVIPERISVPNKIFKTVTRYGTDSTHDTTSRIYPEKEITLVHGRNPEEYKRVSMYLTPYMESEGIRSATFYFTDEIKTLDNPWVMDNENITVIHAEKIVEIGKAKRKADREAAKGSLGAVSSKFRYPVMDLESAKVTNTPYDLIPEGTPYLQVSDFTATLGDFFTGYFNGKRSFEDKYDDNRRKQIATSMSHFTSAKKIVIIGGNRKLSALVDRVKDTYSVVDDIERTIRGTFTSVPQNVKDIASLRYSSFSRLIDLVKKNQMETVVKDREFRRLINPRRKAVITYKKLTKYEQHLKVIRPNSKSATVPDTSTAVRDIMVKYPLIESISYNNLSPTKVRHLVTYMNAIHDEELALTASV